MLTSHLLGALCTLVLAGATTAQNGTMHFSTGSANWMLQSCTYTPELDDPIGNISVDGSKVNTRAESDGDSCSGSGIAVDTVTGGARWTQEAQADGLHVCSWLYVATFEEPLGEVEIFQTATIEGQVRLTNSHAAAAALGFCRASSSVGTLADAALLDSAAETVAGGIGDLSSAYCGEPYLPNVSLGNGLFPDSDFDSSGAVVCTNSLVVEHRSCAFIRVAAARIAASAGSARARASLNGECETWAHLYVCPHN